MAPDEGGGAAKGQSLFADQGIEIEAALVTRRRGSDCADRRQQDNEHRRRDTEEHSDRLSDPVEIAQGHPIRIGGRQLLVSHVEAMGEVVDQQDFPAHHSHHRGADRPVIIRPEQVGSKTDPDEDDGQVEDGGVVVGRPGGARMWLRPHPQPPACAVRSGGVGACGFASWLDRSADARNRMTCASTARR